MTVVAIMAGLLPPARRIAVPMIGGMISSTPLTRIVISAIFGIVKGFGLPEDASGNRALPSAASAESGETRHIGEPT